MRGNSPCADAEVNGLCGDSERIATCNTQGCVQDCQFSEWTTWTTCSKSCGTGSMQRTRYVTAQATGGGAACPTSQSSSLVDSMPCNTQICTEDCVVSEWAEWSPCSEPCGYGVKSHSRTVLQEQQGFGQSCPALSETSPCNAGPCKEECRIGQWEAQGECSAPCGGGIQTFTRVVTCDSCTNTRQECGASSETRACNAHPCSRDCQLTTWATWGACSESCGPGFKTRTRTVEVYPQGSGLACGDLTQSQSCFLVSCSGGCQYTEWEQKTDCSLSCGGGWATWGRQVLGTSAACKNENVQEIRPCNTQTCGRECAVSQWGAWSECDEPCGGGTRYRSRDIVQSPVNAQPCPDTLAQEQCNVQACPPQCSYGEWKKYQDCDAPCGGGWQRWRREVVGGPLCGAGEEVRPCNTQTCDTDCKFSDWTSWTDCSEPCGEGMSTRSRSLLSQPPTSGQACQGSLEETQTCNMGQCMAVINGTVVTYECSYSIWAPQEECSKPCGGGTAVYGRQLQSGPSTYCKSLTATRTCNAEICQSGCLMGEWSAYGTCIGQSGQDCGNGTWTRTRSIIFGSSCDSSDLVEQSSCWLGSCVPLVVVPLGTPPPPCMRGEWGAWYSEDGTPQKDSSCSGLCPQHSFVQRTRTLQFCDDTVAFEQKVECHCHIINIPGVTPDSPSAGSYPPAQWVPDASPVISILPSAVSGNYPPPHYIPTSIPPYMLVVPPNTPPFSPWNAPPIVNVLPTDVPQYVHPVQAAPRIQPFVWTSSVPNTPLGSAGFVNVAPFTLVQAGGTERTGTFVGGGKIYGVNSAGEEGSWTPSQFFQPFTSPNSLPPRAAELAPFMWYPPTPTVYNIPSTASGISVGVNSIPGVAPRVGKFQSNGWIYGQMAGQFLFGLLTPAQFFGLVPPPKADAPLPDVIPPSTLVVPGVHEGPWIRYIPGVSSGGQPATISVPADADWGYGAGTNSTTPTPTPSKTMEEELEPEADGGQQRNAVSEAAGSAEASSLVFIIMFLLCALSCCLIATALLLLRRRSAQKSVEAKETLFDWHAAGRKKGEYSALDDDVKEEQKL
eukprot:NODE_33_length_3365_cov_20.073884_g25_i0.p1 GENE.NODE_33_length_3365_cov_20.073884_g25_i0~~NODE_33_length_3365_cov_20.073884_g25_i0.p1  ORF type:complete len:1091 (-),score=159.40 NODE_33_length_3365_cov_20.073884_g25_i0:93-3275(-)